MAQELTNKNYTELTYTTLGEQVEINILPNEYIKIWIIASDNAEYTIKGKISSKDTNVTFYPLPNKNNIKGSYYKILDLPIIKLDIINLGTSGSITLKYITV